MKFIITAIAIIASLMFVGCKSSHEHAGKKAAGSEHAGKKTSGKEHAGKQKSGSEHAGNNADHGVHITAANIKAAMMKHIRAQTKKNGGVFKIYDKQAGRSLSLKFVKIHDPVREIKGKGYFACTDFSISGDSSGKRYDLDFWLKVSGKKLIVTNSHIHKHPVKVNGKWKKRARYTFVNDKPVIIE